MATDMYDYGEGQAGFIRTLQQGPAAFPAGLFQGDTERALLGLKAHANTISHARLVAMEDSFPLARQHLGAEQFNQLSRDYIEQPDIMRLDLRHIGMQFSDFLNAQSVSHTVIELVQIEWAWLNSYHAAEARAISMTDIAGLDEEQLMAMPLCLHHAAQIVPVTAPLAPELQMPNVAPEDVSAVVITRPEADVRLFPREKNILTLFHIAEKSITMRNLLEDSVEHVGENDALSSIFALMEMGVLAHQENETDLHG